MRFVLLPALALLVTTMTAGEVSTAGDRVFTDSAGDQTYVRIRPPEPKHDDSGTPPSAAHLWIPGRWAWNGAWEWRAGSWSAKPSPSATWVPGRWQRTATRHHGWRYISGQWQL